MPIVSVTGAHVTRVYGMGVDDQHPDGLFQRLPKEYIGLPNGHSGSHQFLVHDFIMACVSGEPPPNNVWQAARYLVPGLVAHESALQAGVVMDVPDLGDADENLIGREQWGKAGAPAPALPIDERNAS